MSHSSPNTQRCADNFPFIIPPLEIVPRTQTFAAHLFFRPSCSLQRFLPDRIDDDLRMVPSKFLEFLAGNFPYVTPRDLQPKVHMSIEPNLPEQQMLGIDNFGQTTRFWMVCPFPLVLSQHLAINALDNIDDRYRIVAFPGRKRLMVISVRVTLVTILLRKIPRIVGYKEKFSTLIHFGLCCPNKDFQ